MLAFKILALPFNKSKHMDLEAEALFTSIPNKYHVIEKKRII
jgi:hypothetical protein